jgi:Protein of unknown function (DUF1161)
MTTFSCLRAPLFAPLLSLALMALVSPVRADSCEAIQASIRAKIEAKNAGTRLSTFSLKAIDKDEPSSGRIVGSCDNGAKRILYTANGLATAGVGMGAGEVVAAKVDSAVQSDMAAPLRVKKPKTGAVLTECRDGSTPVKGECGQ